MRMPPDQLAVQMPQHIDDREVAGLIPHLRVEQHLQQQVAQFLRQVRPVLALDRVQYLVGLFQRVPADGGKALLAVPRASAGRAQPRHDRHALPKERSGECSGVSGWADFLLAHASTLTEVLTRRSASPHVDRVTTRADRSARYTAQRAYCQSFRGASAAMLTIQIVFALLFGLAFGSFLNVCISRLPRHRSVVRPASHCPQCKSPIGARDNIPLFSFLLLRGRCRHCLRRISWRYPLVEAAVAVLTLGSLLVFGFNFWGGAIRNLLRAACSPGRLRCRDHAVAGHPYLVTARPWHSLSRGRRLLGRALSRRQPTPGTPP